MDIQQLPEDESENGAEACASECILSNTSSDDYLDCINKCIQDEYYPSSTGDAPTSSAEETSSSPTTEEEVAETTESGTNGGEDDGEDGNEGSSGGSETETEETRTTTFSTQTSSVPSAETTANNPAINWPEEENSGSNTRGGDGAGTDSLTIGLGVGLGVGIPLKIAIIAFIWFKKWRNKRQNSGAATVPPPTEDLGDGQSPYSAAFSKAELSGQGRQNVRLELMGHGAEVNKPQYASVATAELPQYGRETLMVEIGDGSTVSRYELPATR